MTGRMTWLATGLLVAAVVLAVAAVLVDAAALAAAAKAEGDAAAFPAARPLRDAEAAGGKAVLPAARNEPQAWRYTTDKPADTWFAPDFDDSAWNQGPAGFGTEGTPGAVVRTQWTTPDIWLRRTFQMDADKPANIAWLIHFDEEPDIYLNGVPAAHFAGWSTGYALFALAPEAAASLRTGRNLIAVHCRQTTGGQYVDVGIVAALVRDVPQLPPFEPLFDFPVRDTSVCVGGDGAYYLTGTTGYPTWWKTNEGIRVWKSADLKTWQPLGLVWTIERDGTWQKAFRGGNRAIWAPEIHFIKGTFWLTYCVNYGGTGILRSTTGKPEGPYADVKPDGPLTGEIDASLFQDDDGAVYFVYQDGKIARMKDDMTGLAEAPRLLKPANADHVGFEGAFLFKAAGRYYLSCAEFDDRQHYNCMIAGSDKLLGPYGDRYLAIPHGGHNMFFKDRDGQWWSTFFGHDPAAPVRERPAMLRVEFDKDGRIRPMQSAMSPEVETIQILVAMSDAPSPRYSVSGADYDADGLLEVVASRLKQGGGNCRVMVVFEDKRSGKDDARVIAELKRLSDRFQAPIEFMSPSSSYVGTTNIRNQNP